MERRKFLKVLGLSGAAAPLAAKVAFEKETLALAANAGGATLASGGAHTGMGGVPISQLDERRTRLQMRDHIRLFGIPDHVLEQLRQEANWVSSLDFDIANKRSWSLAAKVHEQRQRQFQRKLERLNRGGRFAEITRNFADKFGFEFITW